MAAQDIALKKAIDTEQEGRFIIKSIDLFRKPLMQLGHSIADTKRHILQGDTLKVIPTHFDAELAEIKDVILPYIESGLLYKTNILPSSSATSDVSSSQKGILLLTESLVMAFDLTYKPRPSSVIGEVFLALPNLVAMVLTVTRGNDDAHDVVAYNASVSRDLTDSLTRFMDESLQIVSGILQKEDIKREEDFIRRMKDLTERAYSVVTVESLHLTNRKYDTLITAFCASISETKSVTLGSGNTSSDSLRFLSKEQCLVILDNLNSREVYVRSKPGAGSTTLMVEMARRLSKLGETLLVCRSTTDKENIRPLFEATITEKEFEPSFLDKYQHIIHETNIVPMQQGRRWTFSTVVTADIEEELSVLDLKEKVADLTKEKFDLIEKMEELKIQLREARGEPESPKMEKKTKFEYETETGKPKKEEVLSLSSEKITDSAEMKNITGKMPVLGEDGENSNNKDKERKDKILEMKEDDSFEAQIKGPHRRNTPPFQLWKGLERAFFPEFPAGNQKDSRIFIWKFLKERSFQTFPDLKNGVFLLFHFQEAIIGYEFHTPVAEASSTIPYAEDSKDITEQTPVGPSGDSPGLERIGDKTTTKTGHIYQCPLCSKVYKSKSGYRNHVEKKHKRPDLIDVLETKYNPEVMDVPEDTPSVSTEDKSILDTVKRIKTEPPESADEAGATSEVSGGLLSTSEADEREDKKSVVMKSADDGDRSTQRDAEAGSSKTMDENYHCPLCPKVYRSVAGYKNHMTKVHRRSDLMDVVQKKRHIFDPQDPTDIQPAKRQLTEEAPLDIINAITKGPLMEYNTIKVNTIYCHVTAEKDLVNWPPDTRDEDSRKFVKYRGTCSIAPIPRPVYPALSVLNYWETETDVKLLKTIEWPLLEIGVSEESQVDKNNWIWLQPRSWCLRVGDCPTHTTEVCTQVWGDQDHVLCHTDTMSSEPGTDVVLKYGVLLDVGKGRLAFLDLKKNICLHTFDVDFGEDVFPMFGLWPVPDWFTLRMKLVSGPEITVTEEKKLLIQSTLSG